MIDVIKDKYKLYNEDCLKLLKKFKDNEIDVLITDPPYGIGRDKGSYGFGVAKGRVYKGDWDKKIPSKEIFEEMLRVSKNGISMNTKRARSSFLALYYFMGYS